MIWAYPNVNQHFSSKSQSECPSVCPVLFRFQKTIHHFSTLPTPLSSKQDYTSKNTSNGTITLPQNKLGPTSKPNSKIPNTFFATTSTPQNKQASITTMPIVHPTTKPNPLMNTVKLLSTSLPLLLPIMNCSPLLQILLQPSTQLKKTNPDTCNKPNDIDTRTATLSPLTTSITDLQQQLRKLKKENANLCNHCPCKCHNNGNYCWTHSYHIGNNHTSTTSQNKAPGHQDQATCDNTMGGSLVCDRLGGVLPW